MGYARELEEYRDYYEKHGHPYGVSAYEWNKMNKPVKKTEITFITVMRYVWVIGVTVAVIMALL